MLLHRHQKKILGLACLLTAVLFFHSAPGMQLVHAAIKRDMPVFRVEKAYKVCSLSFDAAQEKGEIEAIVKALDKYQIKATFFVTGQWADRFPETVKQLNGSGHEVMNHTENHPHLLHCSTDELSSQLLSCSEKLTLLTGKPPNLFRPPFGEYDDKIVAAARGFGLQTVMWTIDSQDLRCSSSQQLLELSCNGIQPGSIVRFHVNGPYTAQALPEILETLIQKGYSFEPVSDLLYQQDYRIDSFGKQIPIT